MKVSVEQAAASPRSKQVGIRIARAKTSIRGRALIASVLISGMLVACGGGGSATTATMTPMNNKGLWVANLTNVVEFTPSQLAGGVSNMAPHLAINSPPATTSPQGVLFGAPQGVTFDKAGDAWVMDPQASINGIATPALLEFSAAQLAQLAENPKLTLVPVATITSTNGNVPLNFPQQAVFDTQGNLWVSDHNANAVFVYTPTQLGLAGTPLVGVNNITPAATITDKNAGGSAAFNGPLGIVFDDKGDLFVANNGGTSIVEFSASALPKPTDNVQPPVDLVPNLTINDNGQNSIQAPWALTFDSNGDLWSSNANAPFTLVKFAKASLVVNGSPSVVPVPALTISKTSDGGHDTLSAPNGICFDNLFDLAAINSAGDGGMATGGGITGSISFFTKNLLTGSATVPNTFIAGGNTTLSAPAGCNFGPLVN